VTSFLVRVKAAAPHGDLADSRLDYIGNYELMQATWEVWVPAVGAVFAALVGGAVGAILGHRSQGAHWRRNLRITAYADFVRSYAEAFHKLTGPPDQLRGIDWSDWNRNLAVISMIAPNEIARQAVVVDEAMWRLSLRKRRGYLDVPDWAQLRGALEEAILRFVNLARSEQGGLGADLNRLIGRPAPADPIWTEPPAQPPDPQAT
jgi:hypothetical protein